jgi:polyferredoxin
MAKVGKPPNLITYDTERRIAERSKGRELTYRILRPRTVLYAMIFAAVGGIMLFALLTRSSQGINVLHDRASYVRLSDGSIRNGYDVKILNKTRETRRFELTVTGLVGANLSVAGRNAAPSPVLTLVAKPDDVTAYRIYVRALVSSPATEVTFTLIERKTGERTERVVNFRGPGSGGRR